MNQIILGDTLEELRKLSNESVECVISDPPYNVKYKYNEYKDTKTQHNYIQEQYEIAKEVERILTPNGTFWNINYPENNSYLYCQLAEDSYLKPIDLIAWVYPTNLSGSPFRKGFRTILVASKGKPNIDCRGEYINIKDKRIKERMAKGLKPVEMDWWVINQVKNVSKEKTGHPCQIPEKLIKKILLSCKPQNVLDLYMGSGTTGKVAVELGIDYLGFEMDKKYIELAQERICDFTQATNSFSGI